MLGYEVNNVGKILNFEFILNQHATDIPKFVDKMCKNEIDPASILEDTERIWFSL